MFINLNQIVFYSALWIDDERNLSPIVGWTVIVPVWWGGFEIEFLSLDTCKSIFISTTTIGGSSLIILRHFYQTVNLLSFWYFDRLISKDRKFDLMPFLFFVDISNFTEVVMPLRFFFIDDPLNFICHIFFIIMLQNAKTMENDVSFWHKSDCIRIVATQMIVICKNHSWESTPFQLNASKTSCGSK